MITLPRPGPLISLLLAAGTIVLLLYSSRGRGDVLSPVPPFAGDLRPHDGSFRWSEVPLQYPIARQSMRAVPTTAPRAIPRIQHQFGKEQPAARATRLARREAVKGNFTHAWQGYKQHAWMRDEVKPLSGGGQDTFGGWAATLVDALGMR